jgi:hypothetical protein
MSYILELKNEFSKYDIIVGKTENLEYNKDLFDNYNFLMEQIYRNKNKFNSHLKYAILNASQFYTIHTNLNKYKNKLNYHNIILKRLNINNEHFIQVKSYDNINDYTIQTINKENIINKKVETITTKFNKKFYNYDKNKRELLLQKTLLIILYNLNNILLKDGNLTLRFSNFKSHKTFLLFILLLSHFKYGYIMLGINLYLIGFKENVNQSVIKNIFDNNIDFKFNINIQPKIQYFINYILYNYNIRIQKIIYEILNDNIKLNNINNNINLNNILELGLFDKLNLFKFENILYDILNNKFDNTFYIINIYNKLIVKYNIKNILEIGSSEGILPTYLLGQNSNIFITSFYNNNIKYNKVNGFLNNYKNYKLIINKNKINKDIIKKINKNNDLVLLNLTYNNYLY